VKRQLQKGFTLIELMIVVAIVGILAAVAIPAYQDYIKRSKVSEVAAALAACKTSYADFVATRNALPTDIDEAGCSTTATQYQTGLVLNSGDAAAFETTMQNIGDTLADTFVIGMRACQGTDPGTCTSITATATSIGSFRGYTNAAAAGWKFLPANFRRTI
jgi:type IV pilus assembly protein PilA